MRHLRLLLLAVSVAAPAAFLQASIGTEGASFLDIPVGADPASMGSAYSALATNAYATTWNPAGLGFLQAPELAAQHLAYLQSIHYDYGSFVLPLPHSYNSDVRRGLGVSVQTLGTGDIARTDVSNGQPVTGLGSYSSQWTSYNLSYGQTVADKLSLGVTGKMIHGGIDSIGASAYAVDAGGLYRYSDRLSLAATMMNMGTRLKFIDEGDSLPLAFHIGAAYKIQEHWLLTSEAVYRKTGAASFETGAQWQPISALSLRLGYKTDNLSGLNALAGLTAGVGLHILGQELAYAWVPYGELGDAQYLSLRLHFGSASEDRHNLVQRTNTDLGLLPEDLLPPEIPKENDRLAKGIVND